MNNFISEQIARDVYRIKKNLFPMAREENEKKTREKPRDIDGEVNNKFLHAPYIVGMLLISTK